MSSSGLLVPFALVIMMAISYEPFPLMGGNASDVPTSCDRNQTLEKGYKLYGYPYSTNTRRVLAVLHEKGLSFDRIIVDLKAGDQKKPHFLSINPFGLVPVFLDGHLKLFESRAISQYIETVHKSRGSKLLNHKSYKQMGLQTMWMAIESFEFNPPASTLTYEQYFKPKSGLKTDYKVVNETEMILEKVLDIYEQRLKKSSYLAGESFTLADLYHLPNIEYLMNTTTKKLFENRPSVHRWVAKITARPAWKKACDVNAWYHKKDN